MSKGIHKGYFVLLCDCGYYKWEDALVCGIYASYKEAKEVYNDIKDCICKHKIVKCDFKLILYENKNKKR